jgi:hypothetical protein
MRTTVDIRDDVMERIKAYAIARSISKGTAISDVLERGFNAEVPTKWENGILIFSPGPSGAVTAEHVMRLKDEMEGELS